MYVCMYMYGLIKSISTGHCSVWTVEASARTNHQGYIYIYVCMYVCMYMYMYIWIDKEVLVFCLDSSARTNHQGYMYVHMYVCIYIYMD